VRLTLRNGELLGLERTEPADDLTRGAEGCFPQALAVHPPLGDVAAVIDNVYNAVSLNGRSPKRSGNRERKNGGLQLHS